MSGPWGTRSNTKWKLTWKGQIVGDSESVTVAQGIIVGKLMGRDSWIDCLPYMGPEACVTWLAVLTGPKTEDEGMTTEQFLQHMQNFVNLTLDDLFNCLILE